MAAGRPPEAAPSNVDVDNAGFSDFVGGCETLMEGRSDTLGEGLRVPFDEGLGEKVEEEFDEGLGDEVEVKFMDGLGEIVDEEFMDGLGENVDEEYMDGLGEKVDEEFMDGLGENVDEEFVESRGSSGGISVSSSSPSGAVAIALGATVWEEEFLDGGGLGG